MNCIERKRLRNWRALQARRRANQPSPDEADRMQRIHIAMQLVGYRIVATDVSDAQLLEYMGRLQPPGPKRWGNRRAREAYELKAQQMARELDASMADERVRLSTWQRYARAIDLKVEVPMPQLPPPRLSVSELRRALRSRHRRRQRQHFRPRMVL